MKRPRTWQRLVIRGLLIFILLFMLFRWFEHSQVYHPSRHMDLRAADLGVPVEEVTLQTSDGIRLNAWFFPGPTNVLPRNLVVLLCHGNGGNISHRVDLCETLLELGLSVLSFDYRGYGLSEGRPSEEGTYRDAQAAHAWLLKRGFAPEDIIVYGESLGGGVASELCRRETAGGLILQSTFTSIPDIGAEFYPWLPTRWLCSIRYDTLKRLPEIRVPVMVMHSRGDGLIGFRHSEQNLAAANEPKLFCELRGDHNDPLEDRAGFLAGIQEFLRLVTSTRAR